ncbi:MAG: hypothetical protein ABIQ87_09045 [Rubrivivax sp.]
MNRALIDRIAEDMLPLEAELAAQGTVTLDRFMPGFEAVADGEAPKPDGDGEADSGRASVGSD